MMEEQQVEAAVQKRHSDIFGRSGPTRMVQLETSGQLQLMMGKQLGLQGPTGPSGPAGFQGPASSITPSFANVCKKTNATYSNAAGIRR